MAEDVILLIEKVTTKAPTFAAALERKGYQVVVVGTGTAALTYADAHQPAVIVLNAPSLGSSGVRICSNLVEEVGAPLIHILPEEFDRSAYSDPPCDIRLLLPFTARKLSNRIKRLAPANREEGIEVGPVKLATKVGVVRAHGRETRLTPKAASLLQVFMKHPGKTLDRGFLMRQVWDTNYVGDTRTLDVHVRWVREAIEKDPATPLFIRTVRGVGYRFEPTPPELQDIDSA